MSWNCLFAGYGFYPHLQNLPVDTPAARKFDLHEVNEFVRRCALDFLYAKRIVEIFTRVALARLAVQ